MASSRSSIPGACKVPIFTAIAAGAAAIAGAIGLSAAAATVVGAVASFAARTMLVIGVSRLLSKRAEQPTDAANNKVGKSAGARVQLPPQTDNTLPVVYGHAYVSGAITDAKISSDNTTMWFVLALCEKTDSGTITFNNLYYDGKLVTFDGVDTTKVVSLTTNSDPVQVDTKIDGQLYIYLYNNGSASPTNGPDSAITVLQNAAIPVADRWTATDLMSDSVFAIVKIIYNQDAGTTGLGQLSFGVTNSLKSPGSVISDYLINARYGCGIPVDNVDATSMTALDTYSTELITYTPVGGGSATQARYVINGPLNTNSSCSTNLQQLADACDSWLQYSELTGQWKMVINQSYEQAGLILDDLFLIDSDNLVGGIQLNPIDLNNTYNSLEAQYPNTNIRDQTDFRVINLIDYVPEIMSPNEPDNRLIVQYPQVNNYVQAVYLGVRRMLQSRDDLVITCSLDYSGIQIEAGDVVKVTIAEYGWDEKLFRVSQVQEIRDENGFLGAGITAFEYSPDIYTDDPIQNFVPADNTGLIQPTILNVPSTPTVTTAALTASGLVSFDVVGDTPTIGATTFMDFNYGTTSNVSTHKRYTRRSLGGGQIFGSGVSVSINVNDLPPDTYYWSTTARGNNSGSTSLSSIAYVYSGPGVTAYDPITEEGGLVFNQLRPGAVGAVVVSGYDVPNFGGSILIPVDATGTATRNIPLFYPGVTVTNLFPYAQGLASATYPPNGYTNSSTSAWTPASSSLIYITTQGYDGWDTVVFNDLSSVTWTTDEIILTQCQLNLYTDTANTVFQIAPYIMTSSNPGVINVQSHYISTHTIPTVFPYTTITTPVFNGRASATVVEFGYVIRNTTLGSNLTCFAATLSSRQGYPGPGSVI